MKGDLAMPFRFVLPLPGFVLHPLTSVFLGAIHVYLSVGHLSQLFGGDVQWTHAWKGFGALAGAYIFAALASRGFAKTRRSGPLLKRSMTRQRRTSGLSSA